MSRAFFQPGAFFVDGAFFETVADVITTPATINLGMPGAPLHLLPFRALGGSIVDLDLLYGVLGHQADLDDIQPIFAIQTRAGLIRTYGYEIPRPAIIAAVGECYATLLEMEDIVIEATPVGTDLFGSLGSATRPMSSVTISNVDGAWQQLILRELVLNAPAGLFADLAHTVVVPILTGTISGIRFEGTTVVMTYGFQARRKAAAQVGE